VILRPGGDNRSSGSSAVDCDRDGSSRTPHRDNRPRKVGAQRGTVPVRLYDAGWEED